MNSKLVIDRLRLDIIFKSKYFKTLPVDEGSVPGIAQYGPYYIPLNVFIASKGSSFYILFKKSHEIA